MYLYLFYYHIYQFDLDLHMTLTVKVKLLNLAKIAASLLLMDRFKYFGQTTLMKKPTF